MKTKTEKIWNWSWLVITGVLTIYNLITLVVATIQEDWKDLLFIVIVTLPILFIFIVSLTRVLKYSSKSKSVLSNDF